MKETRNNGRDVMKGKKEGKKKQGRKETIKEMEINEKKIK